MRRVLQLVAATALAASLGAPAGASGYSVEVEAPAAGPDGYAIARGMVPVRAVVSGGVGEAKHAAYHVRRAGESWSQGASVPLQRVGERAFESMDSPVETSGLPNGVYQLEVRAWGDVPPYRPSDVGTFASRVVEVRVDNPPAPPTRLRAGVAVGALRLSWRAAPGSSREDFLGYRLLSRRRGCGPQGHRVLAETSGTAYATGIEPGRYCVRVVSVRRSPVSETIASAASPNVEVRVPRGSGPGGISAGRVGGSAIGMRPGARPPAPPALGDPTLSVSDDPFGDDLPYGPHTVTEALDDDALSDEELGPDPRATPLAAAGGLVLALAALHLRGFLRRGLA